MRFEIVLQSLILYTVEGRQYTIYKYEQIYNMMMEWRDKYPDLIRVETSQEKYGLSRVGGSNDCWFDTSGIGCANHFFTLQDFIRYPENSLGDKYLPTVLLSGALHGNERIGPSAVMEASSLLLRATECEASNSNTCKEKLWNEEGINTAQRQWLARLVGSRRIIVVPAANALGFDRMIREEGTIDPNRDFPYDLLSSTSSNCMRTIAARTLNEIYRDNFIQFSFTYHGGTELLGYEWGNPSHYNDLSPDHIAQDLLAKAFVSYGSSWPGHANYKNGAMNDIIYFVRGGMEDWAYAGSWDTPYMNKCNPVQNGGYATNKTSYESGTLRCFNMLVEASWKKDPTSSSFGDNFDVLNPLTNQNGHVPRNLRLSISAIDLVQPYVSFVEVNEIMPEKDIRSLNPSRCGFQSHKRKIFLNKLEDGQILFRWTVGGALAIDKTQLWIARVKRSKRFYRKILKNCQIQPNLSTIQKRFTSIDSSLYQNGTGYFSSKGPQPVVIEGADGYDKTLKNVIGPVFSSKINVTQYINGTDYRVHKFVLLASAQVDSTWSHLPTHRPVTPTDVTLPQAHLVQARTNESWFFRHKENGRIVQGRKEWFSLPVRLIVRTPKNTY